MWYRLLIIVFDAMQHLIEGEYVQPSDGMHVIRLLWIQVNFFAGKLRTAAVSAPGTRRGEPGGVGEGATCMGWEVYGLRGGGGGAGGTE